MLHGCLSASEQSLDDFLVAMKLRVAEGRWQLVSSLRYPFKEAREP